MSTSRTVVVVSAALGRTLLFLGLWALCAVPGWARAAEDGEGYEVYEWQGPDGVVEYSDEPRPGAKSKHVQEPMTVAPAAITGKRSNRGDGDERQGSPTQVAYTRVAIESPRPDDVLWVNPASPVMVSVATDPPLAVMHRVALRVNGVQRPETTRGAFELPGLERGTYTAQALILDGTGEVVAQSNAVAFHVKRPAVGGAN